MTARGSCRAHSCPSRKVNRSLDRCLVGCACRVIVAADSGGAVRQESPACVGMLCSRAGPLSFLSFPLRGVLDDKSAAETFAAPPPHDFPASPIPAGGDGMHLQGQRQWRGCMSPRDCAGSWSKQVRRKCDEGTKILNPTSEARHARGNKAGRTGASSRRSKR
jgi:hypothetical protein